jgi:hypothetical protein
MQKLQLHIRDTINASSETFNGLRTQFRAIPSHVIHIIAESDLDSLEKGEVLRDSDGLTYVVIDAQTVANHLLLSLLPVPANY